VIENLLLDMPTLVLGPLLLGSNIHFVGVFPWYLWQFISNLEDHCGYDFPWLGIKTFPFSANGTFHNYHHLINIGNYSAQ